MSDRLFIDTSAFIALKEAEDLNHPLAVQFARDLEAGAYREPVTSSYVFDELMGWFSRFPDKKIELGTSFAADPSGWSGSTVRRRSGPGGCYAVTTSSRSHSPNARRS